MPFAQQRAVFISTGTWDAGSLVEQAKGQFEIGVMDFPMPAKDDPEFGAVLEGPVYERPDATFPFAITRTCKHPEVAVDFLRFLSSKAGNQRLNHIIGWIPAIQGTTVPPLLKAFEPHLDGVYGAMPVTLGGETIIRWDQLFSLFQVNQISFDDLARRFVPFYLQHGAEEYLELQRNRQRALPRDEQLLVGLRARAMLAPPERQTIQWIKYRRLTAARALLRDPKYLLFQQRLETAEPVPKPYEFSPEVVARVRARLQPPAPAEHP
jgi:hypothetical protein